MDESNKMADDTQLTEEKSKRGKEKNTKQSFNFWAAFFGIFYYMYKGLWKKGFLLSSLFMIILIIIQLLFPRISISSLSTGLSVALFGSMANMDLRRKEQDGETMWKELPSIFHRNWVIVGVTVLAFIIFMVIPITPYSEIEETSTGLVSEILSDYYGIPLEAVDVKILGEVDENTYNASATLSDDSVVQIAIEYYPDDDYIEVYIPDQESLDVLR